MPVLIVDESLGGVGGKPPTPALRMGFGVARVSWRMLKRLRTTLTSHAHWIISFMQYDVQRMQEKHIKGGTVG